MASIEVFKAAYNDIVVPFEGNKSMRESDPGNWTGGAVGKGVLKGTNKGISAARYPNEDIENMTDERAEALFFRDFWEAAKCPELPDCVAYYHFDAGIQHGVQDGIGNVGCEELLQRALRPAYAGREDGILGPNSMKAVAELNPYCILARYSGERELYYTELKSMWGEYGRGWSRRQGNCVIKASRF